jgi:hypothetical protein
MLLTQYGCYLQSWGYHEFLTQGIKSEALLEPANNEQQLLFYSPGGEEF